MALPSSVAIFQTVLTVPGDSRVRTHKPAVLPAKLAISGSIGGENGQGCLCRETLPHARRDQRPSSPPLG